MANFTDLLGTLIKAGMSPSSVDRTTSALGGRDGLGALTDLLGQVMGGSRQSGAAAGGGLGDLLGSVLGGGAGARGGAGSGLGGVLGSVLGSLANNRSAAGGLGALAGAILGGGRGATRGAVGGGGLALLAPLAFAALQKAGRQPQMPTALMEEETPEQQQQQLEAQAQIIVRAMINAAKADGQIDEAEVQKIIGRLDDNGLTEEEKNFFLVEARKPMDLQGIIAEAAVSQELAAEVYAASLLAIEVDTPAEQQYLQQLAEGLGLPAEAVAHIHATLGVQAA